MRKNNTIKRRDEEVYEFCCLIRQYEKNGLILGTYEESPEFSKSRFVIKCYNRDTKRFSVRYMDGFDCLRAFISGYSFANTAWWSRTL